MELATAWVRELIKTVRLRAIEPRKGALRTTLFDVPPPTLYKHMFPLLRLTDFKSLLSASKALAKCFEVPLSDMNFARFGCKDHDCFTHQFLMKRGSASKEGIFHAPDDEVEKYGKMRCEDCYDVICQRPPAWSSTKKLVKSRDGKTFVAYPHYCHGCDRYLCNR